jgi:hypothetical protein
LRAKWELSIGESSIRGGMDCDKESFDKCAHHPPPVISVKQRWCGCKGR